MTDGYVNRCLDGMNCLFQKAKEKLESFGYEFKTEDNSILEMCFGKVEWTIRNDCNIYSIPEGLASIAIDMAIGEFLTAKKTFSPNEIAGLDLDFAVKQIQEGDTNTVFATGEASMTPEQRLNNFLNYLLTHGRDEFACYRRLRW